MAMARKGEATGLVGCVSVSGEEELAGEAESAVSEPEPAPEPDVPDIDQSAEQDPEVSEPEIMAVGAAIVEPVAVERAQLEPEREAGEGSKSVGDDVGNEAARRRC